MDPDDGMQSCADSRWSLCPVLRRKGNAQMVGAELRQRLHNTPIVSSTGQTEGLYIAENVTTPNKNTRGREDVKPRSSVRTGYYPVIASHLSMSTFFSQSGVFFSNAGAVYSHVH